MAPSSEREFFVPAGMDLGVKLLIFFFYGIICRRYIQKLTKWSQKHNFH